MDDQLDPVSLAFMIFGLGFFVAMIVLAMRDDHVQHRRFMAEAHQFGYDKAADRRSRRQHPR